MREYYYKKIDAFTSGKSCGNPAACLYLEEKQILTDIEKLEIAKQHKGFVSEVVYCKSLRQSELELSYYSSECEVDFCGHGTIACIYSFIKSKPDLLKLEELTINTTKKGSLTVYNKIKEQDAVYITAPKPTYYENTLTREEIAKPLGLGIEHISTYYPIDRINAGLTTLIVPIRSLEEEITLFPKEDILKKFCQEQDIDIVLIFTTQVREKSNFAHTRVFAPKFGYLEDPATGSGNSAFGYYLLKNSMWGGDAIRIEQGGFDIEFNVVKLDTQGGRVLFGGSATDRIIGTYLISEIE
ncbi:MAG: PhzF family phenazine biosynthesis protein [Mobilitalea sp.]